MYGKHCISWCVAINLYRALDRNLNFVCGFVDRRQFGFDKLVDSFYINISMRISSISYCLRNKEILNLKCIFCNGDTLYIDILQFIIYVACFSYKSVITLQNETDKGFKCVVCKHNFSSDFLLRIHIRKFHFNLKSKVPYAEIKKVNQTWFEKVLNSNKIIEIKKTGKNTLVLRKLEDSTAIKVMDVNDSETIDLSNMYPTHNPKSQQTKCKYCNKLYLKRDYKKHVDEVHLNKTKHNCNNCHRNFKRSYQYLKHQCGRLLKVKGVKQSRDCQEFKISSVESLQIPLTSEN